MYSLTPIRFLTISLEFGEIIVFDVHHWTTVSQMFRGNASERIAC